MWCGGPAWGERRRLALSACSACVLRCSDRFFNVESPIVGVVVNRCTGAGLPTAWLYCALELNSGLHLLRPLAMFPSLAFPSCR